MRLNHGEAQHMGASAEHRDASCGTLEGGGVPVLRRLVLPDGGRRAHGCQCGVPPRVAPRASGQRHAAQPVSTTSLGEVHRRMTTRLGCATGRTSGPRAVAGACTVAAAHRTGGPCTSSRRMVASGRAPLGGSKPQWRTCCTPSGKPCGRNRRSNALTSRGVVRRRARPAVPGGEGDRAVREADEAVGGDGALADRRGEGGAGGWPWCWA